MSSVSSDTTGLIEEIYALLKTSFPDETKYSLEYLKWLYLDNPTGTCISNNFVNDSIVKATYAVLPMQYAFNGQPVNAALSLNTATHPDERGKRWFTKLAERTYEMAAEEGIQLILGVANDISIKGFEEYLGFEKIGRISLRIASSRGHYNEMGKNLASFKRSTEYWNWRLANPSAKYSQIKRSFGSLLVATRQLPIVIARLDDNCPAKLEHSILQFSPAVPAYIYSSFDYGVAVPSQLLPSPWHFIVKNIGLSQPEYSELKKNIWLHGIDGDTF